MAKKFFRGFIISEMFIQSVVFNNNQNQYKYNNKPVRKNTGSAKPVYFGADISKEIKLSLQDFEKISAISQMYDNINSFLKNFNFAYRTQFKTLYQNLVFGEKIKGFVFKSIPGIENKRFQVVKYPSKYERNQELLTFSIMDSENQNLLRYRVNQQGNVLITSDTENLSGLSKNPFDKNGKIDYSTYIDSIAKEMKNLELYAKNYKQSKKVLKSAQKTPGAVNEVINNADFVRTSKGISQEVGELMASYKDFYNELLKKSGKDVLELKQAYLGEDFSVKTKGLMFKNIGKNNESYHFCPIESRSDKRLFKIVVFDKNEKLTNSLVFFSDGKVFKQRFLSTETNFFRPNNLIQISDNEIEKFGIKEIFKALNNKFVDFKSFIKNTRAAKSSNKELKKAEKNLKIQEEKKQKELIRQQKLQEHAKLQLEKQQKKLEQQEKIREKELKKSQKEQEKIAREKEKSEKILQKQEEKKQKELIRQQKLLERAELQQKFLVQEAKTSKITAPIPVKNNGEISLGQLKQDLNKLFDTPVEKRSPHLIHERLSNGKVFAGRVMVKSRDDVEIVVSRVKSPKYVDFTYYSIKMKKDGKEVILNIDSEFDKIIASTPEGKPVIDNKSRIRHISKQEFMAANPEAEKMLPSLCEVFEVKTEGKAKVVQSSLKIKKQKALLEQKEKDIMEALNQATDEFFK